MAMARCNQCGSDIPLLGSICPHCRSPRSDVEAQGRGLGGAFGGVMAAGLVFFLTGGFSAAGQGGIGGQLGAMAVAGLVGAVLGAIFPVLFARLFAVAVIGGIVIAVVYVVLMFIRPNPSVGIRAKIRPGMSAQEVTAAIGEPPYGKFPTSDPITGQKEQEEWSYDGAGVVFENGRVFGVRCHVPGDELKAKVRVGMSAQEVIAALNALPRQKDRLTSDTGRPADVWNYNGGSVWLEDGRVVKVE